VRTDVLAIMGDNITHTASGWVTFSLQLGLFLNLSHGRLSVFLRWQTKFKSANLSIINQFLTYQITKIIILIIESHAYDGLDSVSQGVLQVVV
jgi:hypothetical protein